MRKSFLPALQVLTALLLIASLGAPAQLVRISSLAMSGAFCGDLDDEAGILMPCCLGQGQCRMETPTPDNPVVQPGSTTPCPCTVIPAENAPASIAAVPNTYATAPVAALSHSPVSVARIGLPSARPQPIRTQRQLFILNTSLRI